MTADNGPPVEDERLYRVVDALGTVGWSLTADQVAALDTASAVTLTYPYWHQRGFAERNPPPVA